MRSLSQTFPLLLISCSLLATAADWPQANGPRSNFAPLPHGHTIVDDLHLARVRWTSEERDLGFGKGSVSGYFKNLATWPGHPGSCSGPLAADGKVFVSSFRPSGKIVAVGQPGLGKHLQASQQIYTAEQRAHLRENLRIDGDDLLTAIDSQTGKTLWKAVEPGRGVNRYMGKREGFGPGPAYHDGRVFAIGTTGRLYAYDAETGDKLWETHIGPAHERLEAEKKTALEERQLAKDFGWDAGLVVAEGVLIVPLFDHSVDMGLRGVSLSDGQTLWELSGSCSRYATPAVWTHDDRQYVVTATRKGELRMIDPRDGKILWTVGGLAPNWGSLLVTDKYVLVDVNSQQIEERKGIPYKITAAYRLSTEGAERVWIVPDNIRFWNENHMDSCARRNLAVGNGFVYYHAGNKADGGKSTNYLTVFQAETGEVLHQQAAGSQPPLMYVVEDRLLYFPDVSHSDRLTAKLFASAPGLHHELGSEWKPPQISTTAYEVPMEIPIVDGCLFMRTRDGTVKCYDLRLSDAVPKPRAP